jgi:hypothetical protein
MGEEMKGTDHEARSKVLAVLVAAYPRPVPGQDIARAIGLNSARTLRAVCSLSDDLGNIYEEPSKGPKRAGKTPVAFGLTDRWAEKRGFTKKVLTSMGRV